MAITNIFLNKILFIVEILVAEILFTLHLKKRALFGVRLTACILLSVAAAVVFPVPVSDALYSSFMFLCLFVLTVFLMWFCFQEKLINMLFCGIAAYTIQHFVYMFANFLVTVIQWDTSPLLGFYDNSALDFSAMNDKALFAGLLYLLCSYAFYSLFYLIFGRQIKKNRTITIRSIWLLFLVGAGLIVDILLNSVFVYQNPDQSIVGSVIIYVYGCLCCVLLLAVQFELILVKKYEEERDFIKRMWVQEKEQYEISKETIDVINLKCHDIKHQIREIGQNKSIERETVEEIESSISIYDAAIQTGHEVLDIILTEKSLRCYKNKILFSCIADGEKLQFMNDTDVYSLFGNALDNAIEAVMKLENPENRIIGLTLRAVGSLVSLNINNSFEGDILFENDLPKTTKADAIFHGYGMKSIKVIVEKYGGNLTVSAKNNLFNLDILFPVQKKRQS